MTPAAWILFAVGVAGWAASTIGAALATSRASYLAAIRRGGRFVIGAGVVLFAIDFANAAGRVGPDYPYSAVYILLILALTIVISVPVSLVRPIPPLSSEQSDRD